MRNLENRSFRRRVGRLGHLPACLALGACMLAGSAALAQPREMGIELTPLIGYEFFATTENLVSAPTFGLGVGFDYNETLGAELSFGFVPTEMDESVITQVMGEPGDRLEQKNSVLTTNILAFGLLHLREKTPVIPYVQAGVGLKWNNEPDYVLEDGTMGSQDFDFEVGYGAGVKYFPMEWLGLRLDAKHMLAFDRAPYKVAKIAEDGNDGFNPDNAFNNLVVTLGVTFLVGGGPGDDDEDGVLDDVDKCLDQQEDTDKFQDDDGCPDPDNDGDGLLDAQDRCPDQAEDKDAFQDEDGCPDPDNDNDGVPDTLDKCPLKPEMINKIQDEDGCPEYDTDGDGVLDPVDKCVKVPEDRDGFQDEDGCPELDNDGDGIPDSRDAAPNQPETFNNYLDGDGAPDEVPEKLKEFAGSIQGINFQLGSDRLMPQSLPIRRRAATTLKEFAELKVSIEGHTDSRGDRQYNVDLSQKRADSVKNFLIQNGVAAERLAAKGFGPDKPVDPAETEEAHAKNRRVEFKIRK